MSSVIGWIKSNILIVVCLVVSILSLVSLLVWPTSSSGSALVEEINKKAGPLPKKLDAYHKTQIEIPPQSLDDIPKKVPWPASQAVIDALKDIFVKRDAEYQRFAKIIVNKNRRSRTVFSPGVLPTVRSQDKLFTAKKKYLDQLDALYATLKPAVAPTAEEKNKQDLDVEVKWKAANAVQEVTPELRPRLNRQIAIKRMALFKSRAIGKGLYAESRIFRRLSWAQEEGKRAAPSKVYEGHLQVWILNDLIEAIRTINTPKAGGGPNLISGPIKRLVAIGVNEAYVGLPETGGQPPEDTANSLLGNLFQRSSTGRRTNPLYDVHHAELVMVADTARIPKIVNAFRATNFMTVLKLDTAALDPFADYRAGYYYGSGENLATLTLNVEVIMFRRWTAGHDTPEAAKELGETLDLGYMPNDIRWRLGIPVHDPKFKPPTSFGFELTTSSKVTP